MMLSVAVTFLIFTGASNRQFEYLTLSLTSAVANADVALFAAKFSRGSAPISLKEAALREQLD